jgi:hypothetical protein
MSAWNLTETHTLVRTLFSHEQEQFVRESTRSVNDRKIFASYHFTEAMRLSRAFERKHLSGTKSLPHLHTQGAEGKRLAFERYIAKAGAHSLAAVQSIHAIPDILAHVVYFATGQNLKRHSLKEPEIAVGTVAIALRRECSFTSLSKPLASLQSGTGWRHVAAVCNMSKHRSVVRSSLNEDWTGTRKNFRELYVSSFERHGVAYPPKSLRDLLEPEYDRISLAVVEIGNELNSCLRELAA